MRVKRFTSPTNLTKQDKRPRDHSIKQRRDVSRGTILQQRCIQGRVNVNN